MPSLAELSKHLNRPAVYISGLQARFELPPLQSIENSNGMFEFLRAVIALRAFNVSEDLLRDLWRLEKKLLQLVHADCPSSPTWFLDCCGQTSDRHRRLLLTNYDVGMDLAAGSLQLGLDFTSRPAELFGGSEMGEDALRVLSQCVRMNRTIFQQIKAELPLLRSGINWAAPLAKLAPK